MVSSPSGPRICGGPVGCLDATALWFVNVRIAEFSCEHHSEAASRIAIALNVLRSCVASSTGARTGPCHFHGFGRRGSEMTNTEGRRDVAVVTPWYPMRHSVFSGAFVQAMVAATAPGCDSMTVYHTDGWGTQRSDEDD